SPPKFHASESLKGPGPCVNKLCEIGTLCNTVIRTKMNHIEILSVVKLENIMLETQCGYNECFIKRSLSFVVG
ncbi:Protein of unknown function, partial [Gryllus bimaculatus]